MSNFNRVLFSSSADQWETPEYVFEELDREFHFTLDVAADERNKKCEKFFSKEDDGLSQEWSGTVWCNPPYGRQIGKWVKKASEAKCTVVMLIPARTDTKWFHDYILGKADIRFIRGRLKFGGAKNGAPFPSMVVVFNEARVGGGR